MNIDLDTYSASRRVIHNWLEGRNPADLISDISTLAVFSHCPCIVVAYYAGEKYGFSQELITYIGKLKSFYGYTEILNKPEGSP